MSTQEFFIEIDEKEMAVRLMEALSELPRPPGASAEDVLGCATPQDIERMMRTAIAAINYCKECIANKYTVQ